MGRSVRGTVLGDAVLVGWTCVYSEQVKLFDGDTWLFCSVPLRRRNLREDFECTRYRREQHSSHHPTNGGAEFSTTNSGETTETTSGLLYVGAQAVSGTKP